MNNYTKISIDTVRNATKRKCNMIFDRGYDDNKIIDYVDKNEDYFVIRVNNDRTFYFKNKRKNVMMLLLEEKER